MNPTNKSPASPPDEGQRFRPAEGVEDIDGTFTRSEFLEYVGFKLRVSGSSSQKRFLVFWNEEDDEIDSAFIRFRPPPPRIDNGMIIGNKIRTALEHVDLANSLSILAQFWATMTTGGRRYLQTYSQPFGVTYLAKGLCSYRKLSCSYFHSCTHKTADSVGYDGRQNRLILTGPPSRVFINGVPEYSPDVEFYSEKEYPLRDVAVHGKIKNYMAVPVFAPSSQQCMGVLELVSTPRGSKEGRNIHYFRKNILILEIFTHLATTHIISSIDHFILFTASNFAVFSFQKIKLQFVSRLLLKTLLYFEVCYFQKIKLQNYKFAQPEWMESQ